MNVVAGNAEPSFFPGNMEVVEVPVPIAEIGIGVKFIVKRLGHLVTFETKAIKLGVIGVVEFIRKAARPVFCKIGSMKFVTRGAQPLINHSMLKGCIFYLFRDFFMTTGTKMKLLRPLAHEMFIFGGVGIVTGQTIF